MLLGYTTIVEKQKKSIEILNYFSFQYFTNKLVTKKLN